jgi:hypothetical protein
MILSKQNNTVEQYSAEVGKCTQIFVNKTTDYGTSWRVLRQISIVDQIYIKAWRIRQIQEQGRQLVADSVESEFCGIANYGVIALVQLALETDDRLDLPPQEAEVLYKRAMKNVEQLMLQKNHDYGEAWRDMSQQSFVDLILVKLLRIKQILANEGQTIVSEGVDANYMDIINYALFGLIKIAEMETLSKQ